MKTFRQIFKEQIDIRAWFGKSKVVDEHGNPLVVYHGTDSHNLKFDTFRIGKSSNTFGSWEQKRYGAFFADKESYAKLYGKNIIPVYLKIEHPLDMRNGNGLTHQEEAYIDSAIYNLHPDLDDEDCDRLTFNFVSFVNKFFGTTTAWKILDDDEHNDPEYNVRVLKEAGFDGLIMYDIPHDEYTEDFSVYVVFDPDQIKRIDR